MDLYSVSLLLLDVSHHHNMNCIGSLAHSENQCTTILYGLRANDFTYAYLNMANLAQRSALCQGFGKHIMHGHACQDIDTLAPENIPHCQFLLKT